MKETHYRDPDERHPWIDFGVFVGALLGWLLVAWILAIVDAEASEGDPIVVEVIVDDQTFRGPAGSLHEASPPVAVPAGFVCDASAVHVNNSSTHDGTDIVLRSLPDELVIADVELVAGLRSDARGGPLVSNGLVEILIRLGVDKVSSGGFEIALNCAPPPAPAPPQTSTTSTTSPPTPSTPSTTVTTPPSAPSTTSSTSPPPPRGVNAGGGSMAERPWYSVGGDVAAVLLVGSIAAAALFIAGRRR